MTSTAQELYITPEEYLRLERASTIKHEYLAGRVYAMAGASPRHVFIAANVGGELYLQLKGKPCRTCGSDIRLQIPVTGLYTYPDAAIVCGAPQYADEQQETLANPMVVVEVLSPSSEAYDRGDKFEHYKSVESLTDYILIAQNTYRVEHAVRQPDGQWTTTEYSDLQSAVTIASIACHLRLSDIYDKVAIHIEPNISLLAPDE